MLLYGIQLGECIKQQGIEHNCVLLQSDGGAD